MEARSASASIVGERAEAKSILKIIHAVGTLKSTLPHGRRLFFSSPIENKQG